MPRSSPDAVPPSSRELATVFSSITSGGVPGDVAMTALAATVSGLRGWAQPVDLARALSVADVRSSCDLQACLSPHTN